MEQHEAVFEGSLPFTYWLSQKAGQGTADGWLRRTIAGFVRTRDTEPFETLVRGADDDDGAGVVNIRFSGPRVFAGCTVMLELEKAVEAVAVETSVSTTWERLPSTWQMGERHGSAAVVVDCPCVVLSTHIRVRIESAGELSLQHLFTRVAKYDYGDLKAFMWGVAAIERKDWTNARQWLERCLNIAPQDYAAAQYLAQSHFESGQFELAERWGLAAAAFSDGNYGLSVLHTVYERGHADVAGELERLREQSKAWEGGPHYGAVCLAHSQHYWLGFSRMHAARHRQLIDVRRHAAARLLRRLEFTFTPPREHLVFARLRVIRADGDTELIPTEQLAVVDCPDSNVAIRTENRQRGVYHLPEIHRGDALELEYVILHSNPGLKADRPDFFIAADLNYDMPTWRSVVRIQSPAAWELRCVGVNGAPEPQHEQLREQWQTHTVVAHRLSYDDWATQSMERVYRSPHVCCAWDEPDWQTVAARLGDRDLPKADGDKVPDALGQAMGLATDDSDRLRAAFEWIRDRLKYLSLDSAKKRLKGDEIAGKIVAAGVGDCLDKSYLLRVVCQELSLDAEYVLIAGGSGHVVAEVPGSQFDHVLVRARLGDDWMYLDATCSLTPFGNVPFAYQGCRGLAIGAQSALVTLPVDPPERNALRIEERILCTDDGRVTGSFAITAGGVPASLLSDQWKRASMTGDDPQRSAAIMLEELLPSATLYGGAEPSETGDRARFAWSGQHGRRRLDAIGDRRIGSVNWAAHWFPVGLLKQRLWQGLAVLPLPFALTISTRIVAAPGWSFEGTTATAPIETSFGRITEQRTITDGEIDIERSLVLSDRFVHPPAIEDMPAFLEAFEDALRLTFTLRI